MRTLILAWALCLTSVAHAGSTWTVRPAFPERNSLLAGYAATLITLGMRHPYGEALQTYESTHRPLGDWSKLGKYYGELIPNALYVGGEALSAAFGNANGRRRAELMTVASAEAALVTTVLKYVIGEQRPNGSGWNSFPSGHTTTAFAFAAIIGAEHGWAFGVPAYALAAFTGWSRINDNMHYLQDVVAGATVGLSFGLGVYLANRPLTGITFTPMLLDDGAGLIASVNW